MDDNIKEYLEYTKKPWSVMFYRLVWQQLPEVNSCKIIDFGSGLGITANHLAKNNDVIAIEPNNDMVQARICENKYTQIIGGIEQLKEQGDNYFDFIICHNVLEYAKERRDIVREFCRVLKPNGVISLVKHNHSGRVLQKAVFQNNVDEAISLLDGGVSKAANFGEINYYDKKDIIEWINDKDVRIEKVLGLRTFYALHPNNEIRYDSIWQEKMLELEMKVCDMEQYRNISFNNHLLLKKFS